MSDITRQFSKMSYTGYAEQPPAAHMTAYSGYNYNPQSSFREAVQPAHTIGQSQSGEQIGLGVADEKSYYKIMSGGAARYEQLAEQYGYGAQMGGHFQQMHAQMGGSWGSFKNWVKNSANKVGDFFKRGATTVYNKVVRPTYDNYVKPEIDKAKADPFAAAKSAYNFAKEGNVAKRGAELAMNRVVRPGYDSYVKPEVDQIRKDPLAAAKRYAGMGYQAGGADEKTYYKIMSGGSARYEQLAEKYGYGAQMGGHFQELHAQMGGSWSSFTNWVKNAANKTWSGIKKGATTVYNKALKPAGELAYNKVLKPAGQMAYDKVIKPGIDQIKSDPIGTIKKVAAMAGVGHRGGARKGVRMIPGSNNVLANAGLSGSGPSYEYNENYPNADMYSAYGVYAPPYGGYTSNMVIPGFSGSGYSLMQGGHVVSNNGLSQNPQLLNIVANYEHGYPNNALQTQVPRGGQMDPSLYTSYTSMSGSGAAPLKF